MIDPRDQASLAEPQAHQPTFPHPFSDGTVGIAWYTGAFANAALCEFCAEGCCVQLVIRHPGWSPWNEIGDTVVHNRRGGEGFC